MLTGEITYKQLTDISISEFKDLMILFGKVFNDDKSYQSAKPKDDYIEDFLNDHNHISLIALDDNKVIGGLVAYILTKFEQERSEIYIYDLAVSDTHVRLGIATKLIENLKEIAKTQGIDSIFVQADKSDEGAVSFYKSLGAKSTDTYNFDIE